MSSQISRRVLFGVLVLFICGCLSEPSSSKKSEVTMAEARRGDNTIVNYKLISTKINSSGFRLSTRIISAKNQCVNSELEERFKVENDILYKEISVQNTPNWVPYLILQQGKCVTSPNWDHFGSLSVSNCTLFMDSDSIVYQMQVRRVNGNVEEEKIITLNEEYLPIRTTETISENEPLLTSYEVDEIPSLSGLEVKCN